jgi:hypothetical protein
MVLQSGLAANGPIRRAAVTPAEPAAGATQLAGAAAGRFACLLPILDKGRVVIASGADFAI